MIKGTVPVMFKEIVQEILRAFNDLSYRFHILIQFRIIFFRFY
jgi:hypothetical protein